VSVAPSCACVIKSLLGADVAMGQPKWAESVSMLFFTLFRPAATIILAYIREE